MHARVQDKKEKSVVFPVTNGIKQGCVLAPTLFSIMFSAIFFDAFSGSDNGINIWYLTDGSVFNLRRFQAKAKVKTDIVNEFLFANNCALNASTKANMQNSMWEFWLNHQHEKDRSDAAASTYVNFKRQQLKWVEKFTYLGTTLSKSIVMDGKWVQPLADTTGMSRHNRNVWTQQGYVDTTGICGHNRDMWTQQEWVKSEWNIEGNQNQGIPSCHSYHSSL